ncbi:substrate-binding domain-containing protein [Palleronia sp.]|uniref:substrate-binding domain-containing protein n=1 Tax=Palleronia sp. TaxID=1940284 RepID=UPI0035C7B689
MTSTPADAPAYLTVKELAQLLRIKERKVYDLASSGQLPVSRATGKLLFPANEVRAFIDGARGQPAAPPPRPPILLGSHDPLLDWALRESGCGLAAWFDGSEDGLARFAAGGGVAAALHIHDAVRGEWNVPAVTRECSGMNAVLLGVATRRRGFVVRPGARRPADFGDLKELRLVPRQNGAGTEILFDHLAKAAGLEVEGLDRAATARTETDAAQAVARAEADVTFGLEAVARSYGLDFVPVIEERFDLLVDRAAWFSGPMQTFAAFCHSPCFAARAADLGGYEVSGFGAVRWNA